MKRIFYLFIFFFISVQITAQSFVALRDSFLLYEYSDTTKAKEFLAQYYSKTIKLDDKQRLAEYYLLKGWFLQDRSDFYSALESFKKSASVAKKYGYLQREADAYGNIGNIYDDLSDDVKRMEYQQLSLMICEKILSTTKDTQERKNALAGKSAAYGNLAFLYKELGQNDKAIEMLTEGMKIDSSIKNYDFLAISYTSLGNIYKDLKQYDIALNKLRRGINIRLGLRKNKKGLVIDEGVYQAYHNIGNIHKELNNLDSARFYFEKSYLHSVQVNDKFHLIYVSNSFGDLEFIGKNYDKAEKYYLEAFEQAKELSALENLLHITKSLGKLYFVTKNYQKAYEFTILSNGYNDSLNNSERMRELGKAEVNYKFKFKSSLDSLNYAKSLEEKEKIRKAENDKHEAEAATRNFILFGVVFILIVVLFFSVYLIKLYRGKKRAHEIITEQKKLTDHHLEIIAEKQKEIVDSINYAKRIQYALLAHKEVMIKHLPEHFVLFRPKDIVSGDFYWFTHLKTDNHEYSFLAVCDSTGHGVPGAFMSLLNISFINEAINEKNILSPELVLNHARERLVQNLGTEGQKDGFDGIIVRFDHRTKEIVYAAANNSPILINNDETLVLPCDKMPVGKGELSSSFTLFEIPKGKSGILYLPTDGYSDQFGGEKGKKLKHAVMLKYFNEIKDSSLSSQAILLNEKFENWKGNLEQLDDVCIIGVKI